MGQMHRCLTTVIEKVQAEEVKATKTNYHRLGGINKSLFSTVLKV